MLANVTGVLECNMHAFNNRRWLAHYPKSLSWSSCFHWTYRAKMHRFVRKERRVASSKSNLTSVTTTRRLPARVAIDSFVPAILERISVDLIQVISLDARVPKTAIIPSGGNGA